MPSPTPSPVPDASTTRRGLLNLVAQTFVGMKRFLDPVALGIRTTATLPVGGSELLGTILYNSTTKRTQVHDGTSWVPVVMGVNGADAISLEEHILSTGAHQGDHIEWVSGSYEWADGTSYNPGNLEGGVTSIVEELSEVGAVRIRATPGGGLSGTNIQAQLTELDAEKVRADALSASTGTTLVGGAAKSSMTWFQLAAGTLKAQIEQLLSHVNEPRPDIVGPTLATLQPNWTGDLTYAKDNGSWGHVLGKVRNETGGVASSPIIVNVLPAGVRPTLKVWGRGIELVYLTGLPTGNLVSIFIDTAGSVQVAGDISDGCFVTMDFPAYKCA